MKEKELLKAWEEGVLNSAGKDDLIELLLGRTKDYTERIKEVMSKKGLHVRGRE